MKSRHEQKCANHFRKILSKLILSDRSPFFEIRFESDRKFRSDSDLFSISEVRKKFSLSMLAIVIRSMHITIASIDKEMMHADNCATFARSTRYVHIFFFTTTQITWCNVLNSLIGTRYETNGGVRPRANRKKGRCINWPTVHTHTHTRTHVHAYAHALTETGKKGSNRIRRWLIFSWLSKIILITFSYLSHLSSLSICISKTLFIYIP